MITFSILHLDDDLLRNAQSINQTGAWEYDPNSNTMLWSEQTFSIFGLNSSQEHKNGEELSRLIRQCFSQQLQARIDTAVGNCLHKGIPFKLDASIINLSSKPVSVRISGQSYGKDDSSRKILGSIQDVTEDKKAELELRKLREKQQQTQKLDSISRLAGGLAHDFNNILTVILGYTEEMLETTDEHDPFRNNLEEISKACQKASFLVRQLLTFSSKRGGVKQVLDMNLWLQEKQKNLESIVGQSIDLHLLLDDSLGKIKADPLQLEQILLNLCINAREAMSEGGKLTLRTYNLVSTSEFFLANPDIIKGSYVVLEISDTGTGMDQEVMEHLFEPFFSTKTQTRGAGLGLAAVYGMVQQNGGYIRVSSEVNLGSSFSLLFPQSKETPKESELEANPIHDGKGKSILVVEDDDSIRDMICKILSRQNYRVSTANDGNEAVIMIKEGGVKPDLVLSDVIMPGLNGMDLAALLPRLTPGVKVMLMSGFNERVISQHGKLDPRLPFMQKPFRKGDLEAKIRQVLQE